MNLSKVNFLTVLLAVLVVFLLIKDRLKDQNESPAATTVSQQDSPNVPPTQANSLGSSGSAIPDMPKRKRPLHGNYRADSIEYVNALEEKGERAFKEFKKRARLNLKLGEKFIFTPLDLTEDRVIGTYGSSPTDESGIAMFATDMNISEKEAKLFLQQYTDEIPNMKRKDIRWQWDAQVFPPTPDSGLREAKIWRGQVPATGEVFAAVYIDREDRKGKYLFVYSHENPDVLENDGYFDEIYADLKALPPEE